MGRAGCGLNGRWTRLRFENRIVTEALAFALLTIAAGRMSFIALDTMNTISKESRLLSMIIGESCS